MAARGEKRRSVKQRIRDTKRLLSKDDLPETVRLNKERVLKCLAAELAERRQETRDKKTSKKYRMVKFFDKRKVMRRLKILQKEWNGCTDKHRQEELVCCLGRMRNEINYIVHYPPAEKYRALYPTTETTDTQAIARKEQLLEQVGEMVSSGELSDASSPHLSPDLLAQLTGMASCRQHDFPTVEGVLDSTSGSERAQQVRERLRKRKKIQKVAVDEEPEEVDKTKRHLAVEDDFFLVSAS